MSLHQDWIGRQETATDHADPARFQRLAGLLDHAQPPWPPGEIPPLGHWLTFLPAPRRSEVGSDGHPRRGGFLPPIELPRRMWAGGRLVFEAPLALGAALERRSTILEVTAKSGRTGSMIFVRVRHEIFADGQRAVSEEQDLVYREAPRPGVPPAAGELSTRTAAFTRTITPDPTLLFFYSALTYNGHRIHYDADFARSVEGYPGLVVQGPLIATLLLDHLLRRRPGLELAAFSFRARSPIFCPGSILLNGLERDGGADLWACDQENRLAMTAEASFT
jgi:3-methylfumaryl-CoA hydratase